MIIYIASPLFSDMEKQYIDLVIQTICTKLKFNPINDIYSPIRDNQYGSYEIEIYNKNIKALNTCDIMIAILDGKDVDSGTAFEIGYFTLQNKPVLGLLTDQRSYDENGDFNLKLNTMIFGSLYYGELIFNNINDLMDELYEYLIED